MPTAKLLTELDYQCRVNHLLVESGVRTKGPLLSPTELAAMDEACHAGVHPEVFALRIAAAALRPIVRASLSAQAQADAERFEAWYVDGGREQPFVGTTR